MIRLLLPVVLLGLVLVPSLRADIGENSRELVERYGEGRYHKEFIIFDFEPYTVTVYLDENKRSRMEIAARLIDENGNRVELESNDPSTRAALTEADVRAIMGRNSNGRQWRPTTATGRSRIYLRADNRVMAVYSPAQRTITFQAAQGEAVQ